MRYTLANHPIKIGDIVKVLLNNVEVPKQNYDIITTKEVMIDILLGFPAVETFTELLLIEDRSGWIDRRKDEPRETYEEVKKRLEIIDG